MSNPLWMRGLVAVSVLGLSGFAACGGEDEPPKGDGCYIDGKVDTDCDGLTDEVEIAWGLNPNNPDSDGNTVIDGDEDPDDDGLPNWAEAALGLDHMNPRTSVPGNPEQSALLDGHKDTDGDGAVNMAEAWLGRPNAKEGTVERIGDPKKASADVFQCDPLMPGSIELFHDMAFRFNSIGITQPKTLGNLLSKMMNTDMANLPGTDNYKDTKVTLNVLAPVTNFENTDCVAYFELSATSALLENDEGALSFVGEDFPGIDRAPAVRAVVVQTGPNTAFFQTVQPLSMIFPGFLPSPEGQEISRFLLPLDYITASGTLTRKEDGSVDLNAFINGVVLFEKSDVPIRLTPDGEPRMIGDLLASENVTFTPPGAAEPVGYLIRAGFTANTVPFSPASDAELP